MNRKGTVIGILTALGFLAALIVYLNVNPEDNPYEKYLGDIQFKVLSAYYGSENLMFFYDKVIEYSVYNSAYELGQNGGFNEESECGEYKDYNIWYDKSSSKKCYPKNLEKDFFSLFEESFNEMISNSEYYEYYTYENYDCSLFDLNGEKYAINCETKEDWVYNIDVSRELFVRESISEADKQLFVEIFESRMVSFGHNNDMDGFENGGIVKRVKGYGSDKVGDKVNLDVKIAQFLKMAVDSGYSLTLSSVVGTHNWNVAGTSRESKHWDGYAFDIAIVDGVVVNGRSDKVCEFQEWIIKTFEKSELMPKQVIGPCTDSNVNGGKVVRGFTVAGHNNHIHIGY